MGYKVLITGTSGMVGMGVLLECLDHPDIDKVLIVNRHSIEMEHPKLTEVIAPDFIKLDKVKESFKGYDACYFCAGVSSFGLKEAEFTKLTYDLTLHFAQTFIKHSPNSIFCYVSGQGTDSTEKGRIMWARVKGKTENDIAAMPFRATYLFRPGFIQPMRGIKTKTKLYAVLYAIFKPLYLILKHFPSTATNSTNFGLAMIRVLDENYASGILNNREINELAAR
ncbi:MAG: epimerase [Bacteroidota bacterium]